MGGTLAAVSCLFSGTSRAHEPSPITTGSLIAEMADLESLTRHPGPGIRVVQFSSYDRRSSIPGGPDWFGNADGFGNEPIPGFEAVVKAPGADGIGEYLICDIQQPGAIVRTWTAAIEGTIRVYLDGSTMPIYDGSAFDFLMHKASAFVKAAGLDPKAEPDRIAGFEQRYSDYYPIPFAKSCRIVWIGKLNTVHFYHVQARTYPAGTPITTFTTDEVNTWHMTAVDTGKLLASHRAGRIGTETLGIAHQQLGEVEVAQGQTGELLKLNSAGQIRELQIRVAAPDVPAALRGAVLRAYFDGNQTPQIVSPIGDLFGASPGIVPYDTLPMSIAADGTMTCRFVMPFAKSAVFTVENRTQPSIKIEATATHDSYTWDDRSMHFHARWRVDHDLLARGGKDAVDLPFLTAHGQGLYVGTAVYIMNPCPVPTAGGNWWGEGDEKIFVDGEPRPSIFGTGSEDYFNYAWSESDIFQYPYFSQPICTGPETRGYITNNRWHILDAIPFDRSIVFNMELFAHTPTPHMSYARLAYWYAKPGSHNDEPGINDADLRVAPLLPWTVRAAGGATGASIFEAEDARDPASKADVISDVRYSAGKLARFTGPSGAIRIRTDKAGKYQVVFTCTSGPRPVAFSASIGGTPLMHGDKNRFELSTPHFERIVNVRCTPIELSAGEHTLQLDGISHDSSGATDAWLGVDFVWLRPVK
ncbi:MAG: DUF2961 domain-containing protein [Phycisphaerales bacterium]|nr:DUF2961 domain-containing protein [Phycisphaerales bacterium]